MEEEEVFCKGCGEETTKADGCDICGSFNHIACGIPIGEQGYGMIVRCLHHSGNNSCANTTPPATCKSHENITQYARDFSFPHGDTVSIEGSDKSKGLVLLKFDLGGRYRKREHANIRQTATRLTDSPF